MDKILIDPEALTDLLHFLESLAGWVKGAIDNQVVNVNSGSYDRRRGKLEASQKRALAKLRAIEDGLANPASGDIAFVRTVRDGAQQLMNPGSALAPGIGNALGPLGIDQNDLRRPADSPTRLASGGMLKSGPAIGVGGLRVFTWGWCTWYAARRWEELGHGPTFRRFVEGRNALSTPLPSLDGGEWVGVAEKVGGIRTGRPPGARPEVGAAVSFSAPITHVAVVEEVAPDGSWFRISEGNVPGGGERPSGRYSDSRLVRWDPVDKRWEFQWWNSSKKAWGAGGTDASLVGFVYPDP